MGVKGANMAEPNYMLYAQYMGQRNPMAENLDKFGNTLDQIQATQRQRELDSRQAAMQDMQMQTSQFALDQAREKAARQNELYTSLANAQPTTQFVPDTSKGLYDIASGVPGVMQPPSLDTAPQQNPSVFNTPGQIKTTEPDKLQIFFDHAMKYGALDDAKQAIDMKTLIQNAAPDQIRLKTAMGRLEAFTNVMKHVKELKQGGVLSQSLLDGVYRMLPPEIQAQFPDGLQKDEVDDDGDLLIKDENGKIIAKWATSPDGSKTELVKMPTPEEKIDDFKVFYRGYKVEHPKASEGEISRAWHEQKVKEQTKVGVTVGEARAGAFGKIRMYSVLDTKNGNQPVMMNAEDLAAANMSEPGRYAPAGPAGKALGQTALIEDIRGNVNDTREVVNRIKGNFSKGLVAQLSLAANSNHPEAIIGNLVKSTAMEKLSPAEQEYLINLNLLIENGMAMRSVLGAGQGSDELRAAIKATLPNAKSPNAAYVNMQLDKFEKTLNRLSRGVPTVKLRPEGNKKADPLGIR